MVDRANMVGRCQMQILIRFFELHLQGDDDMTDNDNDIEP